MRRGRRCGSRVGNEGHNTMARRLGPLVLGLCLLVLLAACGGSAGCEGVKSRACCTEGHTGAPGDCADLIISHRYDQCAFVDDIEGCKPPREWTQRPHGRRAEDWLCPASYEWVDDLVCAGE
jgi:hypothetical protein